MTAPSAAIARSLREPHAGPRLAGADRAAAGGRARAHDAARRAALRRRAEHRTQPADEPDRLGPRAHRDLRGPVAGALGVRAATMLRERLGDVYDPNAARAASAAGCRTCAARMRFDYMDEVRERVLGLLDGADLSADSRPAAARRLRVRDGAAPRAAAHGDDPADAAADDAESTRRPAAGAAGARSRSTRDGAGAGRAVRDGRRDRPVRLRQRAPPPRRARGRVLHRRRPVTNGEFVEFIEDGGYERRDWWSADGMGLAQRGECGCAGVLADAMAAAGSCALLRTGRGRPGAARVPRLVVRGRRIRALGGQAPPDRGRVGEGRRGIRGRAALRGARISTARVRVRAPRAPIRRARAPAGPARRWATCGSGRRAASTPTRGSRRSPTPSTRRTSSAARSRCCAAEVAATSRRRNQAAGFDILSQHSSFTSRGASRGTVPS